MMVPGRWLEAFLDPGNVVRRSAGSRRANGPEVGLALLLDGRLLEYEQIADRARFPHLGDPRTRATGSGSALLAALAMQLSGLDDMPTPFALLATNTGLPQNARTVAALLAAVEYSDAGNPQAAVTVIESRLRHARGALESSLLELHLAFRQLESGEIDDAVASARLAWGRAAKRRADEFFNAVFIQAKHIEAHARFSRELQVTSDLPSQSESRILSRVEALVARGLSSYLSSHFVQSFESVTTRTFSFTAEDSVERALAGALLRAECLADWERTATVRALLGKYRLLSAVGRPERNPEASFLLLVRAGDHAATQQAVRAFRRLGPLHPLRNVGSVIASRPWPPREIKASLSLLAETASVLLEPSASEAARRLLDSLNDLTRRTVFGGWIGDAAFRALGRLLPIANSAIQNDASKALRALAQSGSTPLLQDVASAVAGLAWSRIHGQERASWRAFLRKFLAAPLDEAFVAQAAAIGLASAGDAPTIRLIGDTCRDSPSPRVAALALSVGSPLDAQTRAELGDQLTHQVLEIRNRAAAGSFGIGGPSPALLLAILSRDYPDAARWTDVVRFAMDPNAPADQRIDVLSFLADHADLIPADEKQQLLHPEQSPSGFAMFVRDEEFLGASLRLRAALGSLGAEDGLRSLLQLATGDVVGRLEAARVVPTLVQLLDDRVLATVALQLAKDRSPEVRAAVVQGLVRLSTVQKLELRTLIEETLLEFAGDAGDLIPLALIRSVAASGSAPARVVDRARAVAKTHLDIRVRDAGAQLPSSP